MRFVQWHDLYDRLVQGEEYILASFARNIGTQSVLIFLQDTAGFFLIESSIIPVLVTSMLSSR